MAKLKEDVFINIPLTKGTHTGLGDFIRTHKLQNITVNQGFVVETALSLLFELDSAGEVDFQDLAIKTIAGGN